MKSLKKTLVLLVVFSMILSTLVPAFAATDVSGLDCEDQVTRMEALGIIEGFEDGSFKPEETITRAQMAVIICKMLGINEAAASANANVSSKFNDVAAGEWYTGWVNLASNNGIISGYPDGTFRPNQTLTLNEVLTLCVKALGRGGYVDKMGTWPANYVTEAARLNLLKDVKGAADANRGTVAIVAWNTLNAATWYVNSENLDGEVSLGAGYDAKTLLAINFADFVTEDGKTFKEIEGVELTDANFADNNRQLVFKAADTAVWAFNKEFDKEPSKNKDEKSFINKEKDTLYVYVPEEVVADLDELEDKEVKIILGEDNVAVMIIVEDDIAEKDLLTAYDANKGKIVVGGTKYTLADEYTVKLNGATYTLENALSTLGVADAEDIEKKIEATVTLDSEDEVKAIELLASATISGVSKEVIVTKVSETRTTYKIETTEGTIKWNLEDEEEEEIEFPKVYVDGVRAEIRDIEAGNVLTVMSSKNLGDVEDIAKIYVSTKTVTGEATKVKKSNNAITVDGEVYLRTDANVKVADEDELEDLVWGSFVPANITNSEGVTLYLNMFGEYVAVVLSEEVSEYTFGVVTFVSDNENWDDEDENILTRKIRVLLADGNKPSYVVTVDTADKDIDKASEEFFGTDENVNEGFKAEEFLKLGNGFLPTEGAFVMFEATADNRIVIEEGNEIEILTAGDAGVIGTTDYVLAVPDANKVEKDDEEFEVGGEDKEYDADETVIFNTEEREIVSKWKSILADDTNFDSSAFMIFEDEDAKVPMYIVVAIADDDYTPDDVKYAMVADSTYTSGDNWYVNFVEEGKVKVSDTGAHAKLEDIDGAFVEYIMNGSKVSDANMLLDVVKFAELADDDAVTNGIIASGNTTFANDGDAAYAETMHVDILANTHATPDYWKNIVDDIENYSELLLKDFLPENDDVKFTTVNEALAAYGDVYYDEETEQYTKSIPVNATSDQDVVLLVEADGKVHEIEVILEYIDNENNPVKEHYTIYVSATIADVDLGDDENGDAITAVYSYAEKANFKVAEVGTKNKDYRKIKYSNDEDRAIEELDSVKVDNDATIYVVSADGTIEEGSWDDVVKGAYVMAYELDADNEANILVVIAE